MGRGISPDNHRPILYHVIRFIQWEPAEISRWVISIYIYPYQYELLGLDHLVCTETFQLRL